MVESTHEGKRPCPWHAASPGRSSLRRRATDRLARLCLLCVEFVESADPPSPEARLRGDTGRSLLPTWAFHFQALKPPDLPALCPGMGLPDRRGRAVAIPGETAEHPPLSGVPVRVPPRHLLQSPGQWCTSPLGPG